jgi:hypothetical protein
VPITLQLRIGILRLYWQRLSAAKEILRPPANSSVRKQVISSNAVSEEVLTKIIRVDRNKARYVFS